MIVHVLESYDSVVAVFTDFDTLYYWLSQHPDYDPRKEHSYWVNTYSTSRNQDPYDGEELVLDPSR